MWKRAPVLEREKGLLSTLVHADDHQCAPPLVPAAQPRVATLVTTRKVYIVSFMGSQREGSGQLVRIALFTTSFPSNSETAINAGVCVKDFAEALADLGHEVVVLTPYKRGARHEFRHAGTVWFRWMGSEESSAAYATGYYVLTLSVPKGKLSIFHRDPPELPEGK